MIWLTWRQFRTQAAAAAAALVAVAAALAITGPRLVDLASTGNVFDQLTRSDKWLFNAGLVVLALAPAVVGAFWGAPLIARELEAGTHRLAWTQSVTRTRWLATKLGGTALAAAAVVGGMTLAVTWWAGPLDGTTSEARGALPARLTPIAFAMRGIAPVGYAVFALVLGVAVGLVLRRTVPAMAVTLAVFTVVQIAMPLWVRPHLLEPVDRMVAISRSSIDGIGFRGGDPPVVQLTLSPDEPGSWVLANRTLDPAGRATTTLPEWFAGCMPPPPGTGQVGRAPDMGACLTRLSDAGYQQQLVYLPASRFWALQWAETGLFLLVSALLAGFCFWRIRRV